MPLLPLWLSNPKAVLDLSIEQIVTTAGDGALKDRSECSTELREFLTQVSRENLQDTLIIACCTLSERAVSFCRI